MVRSGRPASSSARPWITPNASIWLRKGRLRRHRGAVELLAAFHEQRRSPGGRHDILTTGEVKDFVSRSGTSSRPRRRSSTAYTRWFARLDTRSCSATHAGVVIEYRGDATEGEPRVLILGTWLGGVWSVAIDGTNGIGTCIADERPVTVHRSQHFRSRHMNLSLCSRSCYFSALPDTCWQDLDVSAIDPGRSERAHALTGALTVTSARAIEERFFRALFHRA